MCSLSTLFTRANGIVGELSEANRKMGKKKKRTNKPIVIHSSQSNSFTSQRFHKSKLDEYKLYRYETQTEPEKTRRQKCFSFFYPFISANFCTHSSSNILFVCSPFCTDSNPSLKYEIKNGIRAHAKKKDTNFEAKRSANSFQEAQTQKRRL